MSLKRTTLQARIITALVAVTSAVMASWTLLNYSVVSRVVSDELENRSTQAVGRLTHALELPLWSYNRETASAFLEAEMAGANINAVVVYDAESPNEIWLAYVLDETGPRPMVSAKEIETLNLRSYSVSHGEIRHRDTDLGWIEVYTNNRLAQETMQYVILLAGGLTLLLGVTLTLTVSFMLNHVVVRPVQDLLRQVHQVTQGSYDILSEHPRNDELGELSQEFQRMSQSVRDREQALRALVEEKATMLREIHHRVGNNFQVLSSLLNLQNGTLSEEAQNAVSASHNRILSMAMVHERLYRTENMARIDMGEYVTELVMMLSRSYGRLPNVTRVQAEALKTDLDTAVPVGLILNELLSNALLYASDAQSTEAIDVNLHRDDANAVLSIRDRGPGMPGAFKLEDTKTLGLGIAHSLTGQIGGTLSISTPESGGTLATLVFRAEGPTAT